MARLARLAVAGYPHHIIQRGNDRARIFANAADCERFLQELGALLRAHGIALHAYVLMPDHLHFLLTPPAGGAVSRLMQSLGRRYVAWFNRRVGRSGPLFEGRFRSSVIEAERYLLSCTRYIESNPVRARLAADPAEYRWSSYRHHAGLAHDPLVTEHPLLWSLGNTPYERQAAYRREFASDLPAATLAEIRAAVQQGWALGSAHFLAQLGEATSRRLAPKAPGRPKRDMSPIKVDPRR